jgi:transcriptional regulator with XRE-family HTH domain
MHGKPPGLSPERMLELKTQYAPGRVLARLRKERGLTQREMAELSGYSWRTLARWEQECVPMSENTRARMAAALEISADEFQAMARMEASAEWHDSATFRPWEEKPRRRFLKPTKKEGKIHLDVLGIEWKKRLGAAVCGKRVGYLTKNPKEASCKKCKSWWERHA